MPKFELVRMDFSKDGLLEYVEDEGMTDGYSEAYGKAFAVLDAIAHCEGQEERYAVAHPEELDGETGFYVELLKNGILTGHRVYCLERNGD